MPRTPSPSPSTANQKREPRSAKRSACASARSGAVHDSMRSPAASARPRDVDRQQVGDSPSCRARELDAGARRSEGRVAGDVVHRGLDLRPAPERRDLEVELRRLRRCRADRLRRRNGSGGTPDAERARIVRVGHQPRLALSVRRGADLEQVRAQTPRDVLREPLALAHRLRGSFRIFFAGCDLALTGSARECGYCERNDEGTAQRGR